jgi:hypothetical protein
MQQYPTLALSPFLSNNWGNPTLGGKDVSKWITIHNMNKLGLWKEWIKL